MQYLSQNSKLTWETKKESGACPFKKGMMPASPLSLFCWIQVFFDIYLIWELGWVSDKARRVLTTYCAGLFIIGLSQIL